MQKLAILVDVQNVYYTTRQAYQSHFDYNYFWQRVTENRQVVAANAYAIARADDKQKQFQNILRGIGFTVKLKPYIQRSDGSSKGDWDVGITVDMLELAEQVDVVALVSGDGDFDIAVDSIKQKHKVKVEVYGVPALTANSLINSASVFVPIQNEFLLKKSK